MENVISSSKSCVYFLILLLWDHSVAQIADNTLVVQNQFGKCNSIWNPTIRSLLEDEYTVVSQTVERNSYEPDNNCVMVLIGKPGYQWSIRITKFDLEAPGDNQARYNSRCPDFLKLYDAERCDNAKLLKGFNATGMCGTLDEGLIGKLIFTTCANKLVIQFKSDVHQSFNNGFAMELYQYPWTNPTGGPDCDPSLNGIAAGVWRDGTFSEFQNTWNEQPIIPGYVPGGIENDYNKEINGIQCYSCPSCPVDPFDPERDATPVDQNCYRCSKEWDEEYQIARRKCYSRADYLNKILEIEDISDPFLGCRQAPDVFQRNFNYCFCDKDLCNTASIRTYSSLALILSFFVKCIQTVVL